ncbi:MAG TPA: rhodanese-like domain-containing protein [Candidatus Eisenbacteria bacterium]|nr:rhodanese-like domain-containing protein [Candidatus Eisenbacteria bacterium]
MAHHHSPGFLALVDAARAVVREISIPEYQAREGAGDGMILIDVREDHEWEKGRIPGAMHMSRGIIERDIERTFADKNAPLVLYCGGGYRSALAADNLQKMGYANVQSLAGGFREWTREGLPVES